MPWITAGSAIMILHMTHTTRSWHRFCRRGYDVVLMAEHGATPALGLELSEDAVSNRSGRLSLALWLVADIEEVWITSLPVPNPIWDIVSKIYAHPFMIQNHAAW